MKNQARTMKEKVGMCVTTGAKERELQGHLSDAAETSKEL